MPAHPPDLRESEARQRRVGGELNQPAGADLLRDFAAFFAGALIAPDNRWAQHVVVLIQKDEAVHLTRQADRVNLAGLRTAFREAFGDGEACRSPPVPRVLLRPANLRRAHGSMLCRCAADDAPRLIDQYRTSSASPDVDS